MVEMMDRDRAAPAFPNNILVVDDTPANLRLLVGMLTHHGYQVRPVPNGRLALQAALAAPPDLVLLDINMPDMNGYEVCRLLQTTPDTRHIPIIFISALDETDDKLRAFQAGAADYITKPFQVEEVLARVAHQLTIRRLQMQLEQRIDELQSLNNLLHHELAMAHTIQQSFLPYPEPDWHDLHMVCYSKAARAVGGDLYAYHNLGNRHYAIAVGDVSGKGMPAALLMSASMAAFRSLVEQRLSPALFLRQMDHNLEDYTRTTRQNCALVYADIQQQASTQPHSWLVRIANAGCVAPLVKPHNRHTFWLDVGGMPLGVGFGTESGYHEVQLALDAGDLVVFTSDGVVESQNSQHELFGFERLEAAVQHGPHESATALLAHLQAEVWRFTGEAETLDDMTMVVVRF